MNDETTEERTTVTIRRAPRFSVFIVVGALFGFLATLVLTSLFPADPSVGFTASFGYFLLYGIPAGILVAGAIALLLDRRASRHSTQVIASKLTMHVEAEPLTAQENASGSTPDNDG